MAEGVTTLDGKAVAVDAPDVEFARAMAAPVADDSLAPPRRAEPVTEAPKPKRGRPPKSDKPRVSAAPAKPAAAPAESDRQRADGVRGFAQVGAGIALMMDARTPPQNIAWRADAVTLANAAEPLANACAEVARSNAAFAAVLDKVTAAGPYSALVAVGVQVAGQLALNHGVAVGRMFGAVEPAKLVASVAESDDVPLAA